MLFAIRLAIMERLVINMAELPEPIKIAIAYISYSALSSVLQPNHIHSEPPEYKF